MILTAFFRTLGQVGDPRFRSVLLRGIALAVALLFGFFVLTQGLVAWLTPDTVTLPWVGAVGGLDTVLGIGAFVAMLGLSVILMVPVASAMTSLFIEDVAQAVEDRHYPGLPPTKAVPFGDAIRDSAAFLGQLIAANIVALVLYLLLPFAALFIFWALNGFLLGREYFTMAAMRRVGRIKARHLRRKHRGMIWMAGTLMAMPLTVPLVNLVIPILGAAVFTHLFHSTQGHSSAR
ncbi:MAG: EI24 domain-containing protein [Paracoccaceae bacterium]